MRRPVRGKNRFIGSADAFGITNLSNLQAEADGHRRRRYAIYTTICLAFVISVIALLHGESKVEGSIISSDKTNSYTMTSQAYVDSVEAQVNQFTHKKSGMQVVSMTPKDVTQDATFGLNFRTLPQNNRGAARVVERALLTGSEKYPVKDPFNQLKRGSLQTYMDSWTNKDRTSFVMASRNKADFRNSMQVILDSVFHPLMTQEDGLWVFLQEGWRLELDDQVTYLNGNILNEAKATQMHPAATMTNYLFSKLFPDHTYSYNVRGEVANIVSLTWNEVIDFYNKYYHPSNGQAFCFGPEEYVQECLQLLDEVLNDFESNNKIRKKTEVSWENSINMESELEKVPYASYEDANDFRLAWSWVLNDQHMDARTEVAWFLIQELLIGSSVATLSKEIIDLGLGDNIIGGLEHSLQQWTLTLGVSGVDTDEKVKIAQKTISDKLEFLSTKGFPDNAMKAAINTMEFKLREQLGQGMPRGVATFQSILGKWNYDQDPKLPLLYSKAFAALKEEIETDGQDFLLELITKRLLDNRHNVVVELYPSTQVATNHERQEQAWLDNLDQYVSKDEGLQLLRETKDLHERQQQDDTEEDLAKIPRLSLDDLSRTTQEIPLKVHKDIMGSGITMLEHELPFTNGLAYVDFAVDISNLDFDDVVLLPLFCQMMLQSGFDQKDAVHFQREVDALTGGMSATPVIEEIVQTNSDGAYVVPDGNHMVSKIVIRASCVAETGCMGMFTLIKQAFFDSDMTNKVKAKEILEKLIDDMEDDIQTNGHKYTTVRIMSHYTLPGFAAEQWRGISQLFGLRRALTELKSDWVSLRNRLLQMQDILKRGHRNGMLLSITGDHQSIKDISGAISVFVQDQVPLNTAATSFDDFATAKHPWVTKGTHRMEGELNAEKDTEGFLIPTRINNVGKGGVLYDVGEKISGYDMVVASYLGGYYLYEKLRFNLGAQQASATLDIDSGTIIYQSDQDPNIVETLDVYEHGANWLFGQVSGRDSLPVEANAAIIGAIGAMDGTQYQPATAGYTSMLQYLKQDSSESRQLWRDEILGATVSDFLSMVERLGSWVSPKIVVITNQKEVAEAATKGLNVTTCNYDGVHC